ncbi:MAG: hypothetical protein AAF689_14650 [Pseudomonadota bacterium]
MADLSKLKAALRRTAADGIAPVASVPFDAPDQGVALILDAVDRAVMGRRVTVAFNAGAALSFEAAGRRLMRFVAPLPMGVPLSPGEELKADDTDMVAAALLALCTAKASLTITSIPTADTLDPTEGGLDPDKLREAAGLAPPATIDTAADLNMEPFIDGLLPSCTVALWIQDEDVSLVTGDETRAAALSQWAAPMLERLLAPEFPLAAALETDGLAVFVLPKAAARHAIVAGRLGAYLVAEITGDDPSETVDLWQKLHV